MDDMNIKAQAMLSQLFGGIGSIADNTPMEIVHVLDGAVLALNVRQRATVYQAWGQAIVDAHPLSKRRFIESYLSLRIGDLTRDAGSLSGPKGAPTWYKIALKGFDPSAHRQEIAQTYLGLGAVFEMQNEYHKALHCYQISELHATGLPKSGPMLRRSIMRQGTTRTKLQDLDGAKPLLMNALDSAGEQSDAVGVHFCVQKLVAHAMAAGRYDTAEKLWSQLPAIEIAQNALLDIQGLILAADLAMQTGEPKRSDELILKATDRALKAGHGHQKKAADALRVRLQRLLDR